MENAKCLVQLDEILNYLSKNNLEKIPYEIRNSIKQLKDKEYVWKYDESKALKEQKLDRKTIAMLSYINMEYLLNKEQKEHMEKIHRINEQKLEKEKQYKYNQNNIFKSKTSSTIQENALNVKVDMVEYKESILKRIINMIKKFIKNK